MALQATVKLSKNVAPGLTLSLSDEFPNPHKKGKVCSKSHRIMQIPVISQLIASQSALCAHSFEPMPQMSRATVFGMLGTLWHQPQAMFSPL